METDVDDIFGDIHQDFRDDNSHSIYNNISLDISNSTTVRLVSLITLFKGYIL